MTSTQEFQKIVWNYYEKHKRDLPWRNTFDPYKIWLSEIMLQQTQVVRVIEKYELFLKHYPTVHDMAEANLEDILKLWIGLGYNRRARFLLLAAKEISHQYSGIFPDKKQTLMSLPGIGDYTASAILTFAFNQPEIVIETNIRTAIFYHFMIKNRNLESQISDIKTISDSEVHTYVAQTLDLSDPRNWYYALMDYGAFIKQTQGNLNKMSKHYTSQSKFEGSKRQLRAQIVKYLLYQPSSLEMLEEKFNSGNYSIAHILQELEKEGLIKQNNSLYRISS